MRSRLFAVVAAAAALTLPTLGVAVPAHAATHKAAAANGDGPLGIARDSEPVVLTGAQVPGWAEPAAVGVAKTQPSGANTDDNPLGDNARTAHNGTLEVPPDLPGITPVDPNTVAAYSWANGQWTQIPVQVDKRFLYFLANGHSNFGFYSGTDQELTYAWGSDAHDTGEEAWKKMFGTCDSQFASSVAEVNAAITAGWLTLGPQETAADYLTSMQDPQASFDTDDELSFMAKDAGAQAPATQAAPAGASDGQVVSIADPLDPSTQRFVYLFTQPGGSKFNASNGYVQMARDSDSEKWLDRYSFSPNDPMKIGTSNTGYGPNIPGTVCQTAPDNDGHITTPNGQARASTDREPRDDFTIKTPTYSIHATGRWLVQGLNVVGDQSHTSTDVTDQAFRNADASSYYGPNIIARWKGRAFQQSPDSDVSLVGFEDEQVNWEMNSALLGWRVGPVRAIREIWGADSGTNVTKVETYYRDADVFAFHMRVHPIPPDGLYTDWDYRPGVATTYYNLKTMNGVAIDGQPDNIGEVDSTPAAGPVPSENVETNVCDPTFAICSAIDNPEEVAGKGFGLVYEFELTSPTSVAGGNVAIQPYYRDDACYDDGTGDAPAPRPQPGDASTDADVQQGYLAYWQNYWQTHPQWQKFPEPQAYSDLKCQPADAVNGDPTANPSVPPWQVMPFEGAIGENGVHFFFTQDSDNDFSPEHTDEVDGQQWRFEVPMTTPTNVLVPYGADVSAKLVAVVAPFGVGTPGATLPEVPLPVLLPAFGAIGFAAIAWRRRKLNARRAAAL